MTLFQSSPKGAKAHCEGSSSTTSNDSTMSTATMDAPSTPMPMQVEVDVSIGSNAKDTQAEEASAEPADKRECTCGVYLQAVCVCWLHPRMLGSSPSQLADLFVASRSEFSSPSHRKSSSLLTNLAHPPTPLFIFPFMQPNLLSRVSFRAVSEVSSALSTKSGSYMSCSICGFAFNY